MNKFIRINKDGGPHSKVWIYALQIKKIGTIALLRFEDGSREAYHSHAFNCFSWVLKGKLVERHLNFPEAPDIHTPALRPFGTYRQTFHKVESIGRTWVLSFRGPWADRWHEYLEDERRFRTLTHGRREITI